MLQGLLNFWDLSYTLASNQPTFTKFSIGCGLVFICLTFVYAIFYSKSFLFKITLLCVILLFVNVLVYLITKGTQF
jgi:hypothetical protein